MKAPVELTTPRGVVFVWPETIGLVGAAYMDYALEPAAMVRRVCLAGGHNLTMFDTPENLTKVGVA